MAGVNAWSMGWKNKRGRLLYGVVAQTSSLVLGALLFIPPAARSQQERLSAKEEERSTPAVDALKEALRASIVDPTNKEELQARRQALREAANQLKGVRDLRLALLLPEWRDERDPEMQRLAASIDRALGLGGALEFVPLRPEEASPLVDRSVHKEIEARFARIVLDGLRSRDAEQQIAAATLLAETGAQIPSTRSRRGFASTFAPELAKLLKDNNPAVVESAARALGRIFADPEVAGSALGSALQDGRGPEKRAAAAGLVSLIENTNQLAKTEAIFGVKPSAADRLGAAQEATKAASRGLHDADPVVRRLCAEAMQRASETLEDIIPDEKESTQISPEALSSFAEVLGQQGKALASLLKDSNSETRLTAAQALMEMARALSRSSRRTTEAPSLTQPKEKIRSLGSDPVESLRKGLRDALPALSNSLSSADVRVRLAAVTVLDLMGPQAAAAAPALAHALRDPDIFVRWAAARTLGNIPASDGKIAVPGLGHLLFDPDLDPRLAAAATLDHYGKDAAAAVPDLTRAIGVGDSEIRVAVIHALEAIGSEDARSAVPALAQALNDPDDRVRQAAAETLGSFGPAAQSAEPALRRALDDKENTVRKAASSALLNLRNSQKRRAEEQEK
jgi:HEAT repeat protein